MPRKLPAVLYIRCSHRTKSRVGAQLGEGETEQRFVLLAVEALLKIRERESMRAASDARAAPATDRAELELRDLPAAP